MTSCVCLLYTCSAAVQVSASDDLLNFSISLLKMYSTGADVAGTENN